MASGFRQGRGNSFVANGLSTDVKGPGFKPCLVEVTTQTGVRLIWHEGMPDGTANKILANGTSTIITTNGITPLNIGFNFGADADANVNGQTCYWWCEE